MKHHARLFAFAFALAAVLTWFYTVHEALPIAIRAPSSLILTPVAVASLLGMSLGIEVYGNLALVFSANLLGTLLGVAGLDWLLHRSGRDKSRRQR